MAATGHPLFSGTEVVDDLAMLKAAFADPAAGARFPEIDWSVTAGNSSQITDGAAALLIMSEQVANKLGLRPRARFVAVATRCSSAAPATDAVAPWRKGEPTGRESPGRAARGGEPAGREPPGAGARGGESAGCRPAGDSDGQRRTGPNNLVRR